MMTSKERMRCVFAGEKPDQYPTYEHFWSEAITRWQTEGMPEDVDVNQFFDYDLRPCCGYDLSAQYPTEVISEDDTYKVIKDSRGVISQRHKSESGHTPHWLETPIKVPSDWWAYKERLKFNTDRIDTNGYDLSKQLKADGKYVFLANAESYECAWPVFGQVGIFMAMLEEPAVVKDAMDTWADLTIECIEHYISNGLHFDGHWFYGDMGYRNGTLFGPDVYRDLVMPSHKKIVNYLHDHGKDVILHSCGQIKSFIPMLLEVGFDALQPLEAKANQDVRELVPEYGRKIVFFGNMDIREFEKSKDEIRNEIESKLPIFDGKWNYIFHSDHSIPATVSLENYQYALEVARGYLKKA